MKKVILIIRDGWGHGEHDKGNAQFHAKTPNHDFYKKNYPTTELDCTGNAVGNPGGVQGGSEVGHLTMGAGRVVWQPYELINREIKSKSFFKNKVLIRAIENCKENNSDLHIDGLFSTEGVHADYKHMLAFLELCKKQKFDRVYIHLTLDGRDMPEKSSLPLLKKAEAEIKRIGIGKIASVVGRYYAMDRAREWSRTQAAYDLLLNGDGFKAKSAKEAIEEAYKRGDKTDYYVQPTLITDDNDKPIALLKSKDSIVWYSFRSDRARQITALINGLSIDDPMKKMPKKLDVHYVCYCSYDSNWDLPVAFPQERIERNLGETISTNGLKQLRIAETEKFAHVTFFFNSQKEDAYKNEDRINIPTKQVVSYDMNPQMSAYEVTDKLLSNIGEYDFILVNYANPDLVGHSGVFDAVVKACEVVDECTDKVIKKALEEDYVVFLTADHGNSECMVIDGKEPDPSHGYNSVLFTLISNDEKLKNVKLKNNKGQKDVAPTILDIMNIKKPKEMTGESLIIN
jgi:2,3-bisphosphoglycerate-independent phosphoglycerate mutase